MTAATKAPADISMEGVFILPLSGKLIRPMPNPASISRRYNALPEIVRANAEFKVAMSERRAARNPNK